MKRAFLLCTLFFATLLASAQTQQGFVKTKGRMDANGNLIHGQGLKGATVSVQGRTTLIVNADDGAFSFPIPEAQFRLDSVRKKGYQLVDMDACPRTYKYSPNPLYIVMETPEQQLQDQLAAERKIRRTLTDQLQQREDEIEALKEQQKITDEEYRQALQKLYEDSNQNNQLIEDMVERYSKIDYDQLSEFDQLISNYILNGELVKADSLINTKGDINKRVEQYHKHEAVNAKEKEELALRQEQLEQSEALAIQERDDLANDCYRKFEIFKMQHENDSAAYYIELRAELDSTNVDWQMDAGDFLKYYTTNYDKASLFFQLGLRQSLLQYGEEHEKTAELYRCIGQINEKMGNFDKALEYTNKALSIWKIVFGENSPTTGVGYNNLGTLYWEMGMLDKALDCHKKALSIWKAFHGENLDVSYCYDNIGLVYSVQGEYEKALNYQQNAMRIQKEVFGPDHPSTLKTQEKISEIEAKIKESEEK